MSQVIKWVLLAILAIVALKVAFWALGVAIGLTFFLVFRVAPVILVGWLIFKAYELLTREPDEQG
jgi:hypothetical protein